MARTFRALNLSVKNKQPPEWISY